MKARRKKERNKLDEKIHIEERSSKVWKKLSEESLKEWEARYELEQVAYRKDSSKDP